MKVNINLHSAHTSGSWAQPQGEGDLRRAAALLCKKERVELVWASD